MKLNVLELNSGFVYAGGARNLYSFCKYLDKDIFAIFAASHGGGGPGERILREMGVEYVLGGGDASTILDFIQSKNIHILHFHRSGGYVPVESEIINKAKEANPNLVIIERNVFGKYDSTSSNKINCHLFQSMMHIWERFLPVSGQPFDFSKMKTMYNMVDAEEFEKYRLSKQQIDAHRTELGIRPEDFVIGKIGRPHIAKWSDLILDMMPYAVKLVPNLKFIIIGVPESRKRIINNSELQSHYILLDESTDEYFIHKFYQTIDVLAHSSKIGECNGNTINEAMFWGRPVVVNSTPKRDNGQLEQVIHMQDGIIASYPQTFARAIAYLYNNKVQRKALGDNARKKVLDINSPNKIIRQLESVFIESIGKTGILNLPCSLQKIEYLPSEDDILNYRVEYKNRLKNDFGELAILDKIVCLLSKPKKLYFKIRDFIDHRVGI